MKIDERTHYGMPDAHQEYAAEPRLEIAVPAKGRNGYIDGEPPMAKWQVLEQLMSTDSDARLWVDELIQVRALVRPTYGATRND